MSTRIPEIRPISDLVRDARGLVARASERQEPLIITQRGRDVAVLVPIDLYRQMERQQVHRVPSPRLVRPEDAARFAVTVTMVEPQKVGPPAGI